MFFSTGKYDLGSTGLRVGSCTTLAGVNAGGTVLHFRGSSGSAITLLKVAMSGIIIQTPLSIFCMENHY